MDVRRAVRPRARALLHIEQLEFGGRIRQVALDRGVSEAKALANETYGYRHRSLEPDRVGKPQLCPCGIIEPARYIHMRRDSGRAEILRPFEADWNARNFSRALGGQRFCIDRKIHCRMFKLAPLVDRESEIDDLAVDGDLDVIDRHLLLQGNG